MVADTELSGLKHGLVPPDFCSNRHAWRTCGGRGKSAGVAKCDPDKCHNNAHGMQCETHYIQSIVGKRNQSGRQQTCTSIYLVHEASNSCTWYDRR